MITISVLYAYHGDWAGACMGNVKSINRFAHVTRSHSIQQ